GDGDGFINSVLPSSPTVIDLPIALDWSTAHGLHVRGAQQLSIALSVNRSVGGITIDTLYISFGLPKGGIALELSAAVDAQLGPVAASIDRIGLRAVFAAAKDGSFGPVDVELGFKPPNGVGLAINAGVAVGGGY